MSIHADLMQHLTAEWQPAREIWKRLGTNEVSSIRHVLTTMAEQGKIDRHFFPIPGGKIAKFRRRATDG